MTVLLTLLQSFLALLAASGGAYKLLAFEAVSREAFYGALPRVGWSALGAVELACGLALGAALVVRRARGLGQLGAITLAVGSAGLAALYARYSLAPSAENPLPWAVFSATMGLFVFLGRRAQARGTRAAPHP
jgi:hypothetical protein